MNFSSEGGEMLRKMGVSWFVSYAYYEKIDPSHKNWMCVTTVPSRLSRYNQGRPYHKTWLQEVLTMDPNLLQKNTIGLFSSEVKDMAKEILDHWEETQNICCEAAECEEGTTLSIKQKEKLIENAYFTKRRLLWRNMKAWSAEWLVENGLIELGKAGDDFSALDREDLLTNAGKLNEDATIEKVHEEIHRFFDRQTGLVAYGGYNIDVSYVSGHLKAYCDMGWLKRSECIAYRAMAIAHKEYVQMNNRKRTFSFTNECSVATNIRILKEFDKVRRAAYLSAMYKHMIRPITIVCDGTWWSSMF